MMDNYLKKQLRLLVLFTVFCNTLIAQIPSYYSSTDLKKTGQALKTELSNLIISTHQTNLTYTPGVWDALKQTDLDPTNSNKVLLIYGSSDTDGNYVTDRSRSKDLNGGNSGTDWNREHTYPRSLGEPNLGSEGPGSDAHHIRASDVTLNGNRSNLPFENDTNGGAAHAVSNSWYPGDEWRGDVARMMMYMYLRYENRCDANRVAVSTNNYNTEMPDIFLEWNVLDPVSDFELQRNPLLETIQGNRNPFIDNPAFATQIWGGPQAEDRFSNTSTAILINEIDVDTEGSDTLEFIELYDGGFGNTALDGYVIVLYNGSSDTSYLSIDLNGKTTNNDGYFVIGNTDVTNVNLIIPNGKIQNGADAVALYKADIANFSNDTAVTNSNLIDALVYDTNDTDDTNLISVLTPGQNQINEDERKNKDTESIQRLPNGSGGALNTTTFSTALPTPGISNNIPDTDPPTAPTNLSTTNITASSIDLNWDASTDNVGVTGYDIYQNDTYIASAEQTTYTATSLSPNTTYTFKVTAKDAADNTSAFSNSAEETTLKQQSTGNNTALILTAVFDGPLDGGTPKGVEIYVNEAIPDLSIYGLGSANNGGGTDGQEFTFPAVSVNAGTFIYVATESTEFEAYFGFAPDYTSGALAINGDDAVELFFNENVIDVFGDINVDGTGTGWEYSDGWAYRNDKTGPDGSTFAIGNWTFSGVNALDNTTTNNSAGDAKINIGTYKSTNDSTGNDTDPPNAPTNLSTTNITASSIDLNWDASTDNVGVTGYDIYQNDTYIASAEQTTYTATSLSPNTTYTFKVTAKDAADNTSAFSNTAEGTTLKQQSTGNNTALILTAVFDGPLDGGTPKGVEIYVNEAIPDLSIYGLGSANNGGGTDGQEFTFPAVSVNAGTFIYVATESTEFEAYFGFAPDYTSGALAINGDDAVELFFNENVIDVFGDINVDGTGTGWEYSDGWAYRNDKTGPDGSTFAIGNWTFSGVNALDNTTTNNSAGDAKINIGTYKSTNDSTGNDTDAPTAPTNLSTTNITASSIDLNWDASTDNVGVTGYDIYQNDTYIASAEQTTYTATSLSPNTTYTFKVTAKDAADNTSAFSNTAEGTTLASANELISIANARRLPDNTKVTISGILTASDQYGGPAFIQDETGGIAIFDNSLHDDGLFSIGDEIKITAIRNTFNDQVQLGNISNIVRISTNNTITAAEITINQMEAYAGQLVTIKNVRFTSNNLFCGNSNFEIVDESGTGELRIDNDVTDLIGKGVPKNCSNVTGIVGRFRTTFQLLPRFKADLPCSGGFVPQNNPDGISDANTLDVLTWNIEWFGDGSNFGSPTEISGAETQKERVKAIIQEIQPDIIGVQEIANPELFNSLVSKLEGYSAILSEATSYPNDTESISQRVGFIYKKEVINPQSFEVLFKDVHPYYNGGDASAIKDFPDTDKTRFFASGRLPYVMNATVNMNGTSEGITFIVYHARANGSRDSQLRYDMRKYDFEYLKSYLDSKLPDSNVILLGDFNDDADETVADNVNTKISSFAALINDSDNYKVATSTLSNAGYNSYAFRDNMIDHILISNELFDNLIANSVAIWNKFYSCDYTNTTSDHFPISTRFEINKPLNIKSTNIKNVSCFGKNDGSLTVEVEGGNVPYLFSLDGQQFEENSGQFNNLTAGDYVVYVKDGNNSQLQTNVITITQPEEITVSVESEVELSKIGDAKACIEIGISSSSNKTAYNYLWNTGETTPTITVCPSETTTYKLTVSDANKCSIIKPIIVNVKHIEPLEIANLNVVDVSCFGKNDGSLTVEVEGGNVPYLFSLDGQQFEENSGQFNNLTAGDYVVYVKDGNNNQLQTNVITITQPEKITVSVESEVELSKIGDAKACIEIGISSSSNKTAYNYLWNTGETTPTITVCPSETTTYKLTVSDANKCSIIKPIIVNVKHIEPLEIANLNVVDVSCFGKNDGSLTVEVEGGNAPYLFSLDGQQFEENSGQFNNLTAGDYVIYVKDGNNSQLQTNVLTILQPEEITVSVESEVELSKIGDAKACIEIGISSSSNKTAYNYLWSTGETTPTITVCPTETTTYQLTVSDANKCSVIKPITVNVKHIEPLEITELNVVNVSCNGKNDGAANISVSGGIAPYEFKWNTNETIHAITELSAGSYTIVVTDNSGQLLTETITITEPDAIEVETSPDQTIYTGIINNQCVTVGVTNSNDSDNNPYTYQWNTGDTTKTINVCPTETTNYSVTITNSNGCRIVKTIVVEVIKISCEKNRIALCYQGQSLCVPYTFARYYISKGAVFGNCATNHITVQVSQIKVFPNPFRYQFNVRFIISEPAKINFTIYNHQGVMVDNKIIAGKQGINYFQYNMYREAGGVYYLKIEIGDETKNTIKLFKY